MNSIPLLSQSIDHMAFLFSYQVSNLVQGFEDSACGADSSVFVNPVGKDILEYFLKFKRAFELCNSTSNLRIGVVAKDLGAQILAFCCCYNRSCCL